MLLQSLKASFVVVLTTKQQFLWSLNLLDKHKDFYNKRFFEILNIVSHFTAAEGAELLSW